jgi:hypothetical protein
MVQLTIEITRLNKIAYQKLATKIPGTINAVSEIIIPLITRVNRPRVRIFIGKVIRTKSGLIKALISPNTSANIKAAQMLLTNTPGKIYAPTMTAKVTTRK